MSAIPSEKSKELNGNKRVTDILKKMSKEDLDVFFMDYASRDEDFRNHFISKFIHLIETNNYKVYKSLIKSILRSAKDKQGFVSYRYSRKFSEPLYSIVDQLSDDLQNNYSDEAAGKAWDFIRAMFEEGPAAVKTGDDSDGNLSGPVDNAFELLRELLDNDKLPESFNSQIYDFLIKMSDSEQFTGWDWQWNCLEIAIGLVENDEQEEKFVEKADKLSSMEGYDDFNEKQAAKLKIELYKSRGKHDLVNQLMEKFADTPDIREARIKEALEKKNYYKVIELATDGVEKDKDYRGLVCRWNDYILQAYIETKNTAKILELARQQWESYHEMKYFRILKEHYDESKWKNAAGAIIDNLEKNYRRYGIYFDILAEEERYAKLTGALKEAADYYSLRKYEPLIIKDHFEGVVEGYALAAKDLLKTKVGRNFYKGVVTILKHMKKIGAKTQVESLLLEIMEQYKNRPALLEELKRV